MTAVDWRAPVNARAEEVAFMGSPDESSPEKARRGILWHLGPETYARVMAMQVCWNCLTSFPARPMALTIGIWDRSGFVHVRPKAVVHRLLRECKCPVCASEITPEMLGIQDKGENPLNKRGNDYRGPE